MKLTTIREIYKNREAYLDKEVTVGGWVRSVRDSKTFGFIVLHDGSYFETLQIVYHDEMENFAEISKTVHESNEPVFLTKNGYGDMVVMSLESYENLQFESEIYYKLREAEEEAELTNVRFSSKDILKTIKETIKELEEKYKVLKIAKSIDNKTNSFDQKIKINEMLREIDKCIGLLNK